MSVSVDYVVGLDIAKQTVAVCCVRAVVPLEPLGEVSTQSNDSTGCRAIHRRLVREGVVPARTAVVMEATGVYWEGAAFFFHEKGYVVRVVNPAQIRAYSQTLLRRGKTDAQDADLLARFGASVASRSWTPPDALDEELKQIMRQRDDYVTMRTQQKNRLHALEHRAHPSKRLVRMNREHLQFLDRQIQELERAFKEQLLQSPKWRQAMERLQTIAGFGLIVAGTMLCETNGLSIFHTDKQRIAYAGLAPVPYESGSSVRRPRRLSKIGNPRLRRMMYLAAVSGIRAKGVFREFYLRLRARGKPAKVALVAVARKMLRVAFAIVRSGQPFDPNYRTKTA